MAHVTRAFSPASEAARSTFLARYSGGTRQTYTYALQRFFRWCEGAEVEPLLATRADLEEYSAALVDEVKSGSTCQAQL